MNGKMNFNKQTEEAKPRGVVGAVWVQNPAPWWVPVGLEKTQGPNAKETGYRTVFFGGTREYKDDEDGFQVYHSRRYRRMQKWLKNKSLGINGDIEYSFNDEQAADDDEYNNYETYNN